MHKRTLTLEAEMVQIAREMDGNVGFDFVIVCTNNVSQEQYWQERLDATRGQVAKLDAVITVVHEDWSSGGAGNAQGTLYAYRKAREKISTSGVDLDAMLACGKTVSIYHTAGKGTRLAPLPGAENNNKPGVKLPSLVETGTGEVSELTILGGDSTNRVLRPKATGTLLGVLRRPDFHSIRRPSGVRCASCRYSC